MGFRRFGYDELWYEIERRDGVSFGLECFCGWMECRDGWMDMGGVRFGVVFLMGDIEFL